MAIDLGSLRQALATLERAMGALQPPERFEALDADIQETLQAGVIQSFEFSYELSWKYMERWLRENADSLEAAPRTRKDLFRAAARRGLIEEPVRWFAYTEALNLSSHTYDAHKATQVLESVASFHTDAVFLLRQLERAND